jgi:hypothetical protein
MGQHIRFRILQWTSLPVYVRSVNKRHSRNWRTTSEKFSLFDSVCDFSNMSTARIRWLLSRIDVGEGVGGQAPH